MHKARVRNLPFPNAGAPSDETLLGVHIIEAGTPVLTGRELAREMGAELAEDAASTMEALSRRVEAGNATPVMLPEQDLAALQEEAARARRVLQRVPVDEVTRAELTELADDLAVADRIRRRTESVLADALTQRLVDPEAPGHDPEALRHAAVAVAVARADVLDADRALADLDPAAQQVAVLQPAMAAGATTVLTGPPAATPPSGSAGSGPTEPGDTGSEPAPEPRAEPANRQPAATARPAQPGARLLLVDLALELWLCALVAWGRVPAPVAAAVIVMVLAPIQVLWLVQWNDYLEQTRDRLSTGIKRRARMCPHRAAAATAATAGDPFLGEGEVINLGDESSPTVVIVAPERPADIIERDLHRSSIEDIDLRDPSGGEPPEPSGHRPLESVTESAHLAQERLQATLAQWEALAGAGTDPDDVEAVIHARTALNVRAAAAALESATVRTAQAFHRRALAKWRVAWAMLGYDLPPDLLEAEFHLAPVTDQERNDARAVLQRAEAAERWMAAGRLIDRPLVIADAGGWFPSTGMSDLLRGLPTGAHVVVVRQASADAGLVTAARSMAGQFVPWVASDTETPARLALIPVGFLPVTLIAAAAFRVAGLLALSVAALLPALAMVAYLAITRPQSRRLVGVAVLAGMVATAGYDLYRWSFIWLDMMGPDPIPHIGHDLHLDPAWVFGYLWRYLGNGGGLAVAFVALGGRGWRAGLLYGLFVCSGLTVVLTVAPLGEQMLWPFNVTTMVMIIGGHAIYGVILGLITHRLKDGGPLTAIAPWY